MCGRYSLTSPPEAMRRAFALTGAPLNLPPCYNIAPTQAAPVVRAAGEGEGRGLVLSRWGLVPHWSKGPDNRYSMINARAETVTERPAYRDAFRSRRCLVPADGFYEWQATPGRKQPYRVTLRSGEIFAFAGLWERWRGQGGDEIESFTIIVTGANELVRSIHARMPVILAPDAYDLWLAGGPEDLKAAEALLKPYPSQAMTAYAVGAFVNDPKNDDEECIERIDDAG